MKLPLQSPLFLSNSSSIAASRWTFCPVGLVRCLLLRIHLSGWLSDVDSAPAVWRPTLFGWLSDWSSLCSAMSFRPHVVLRLLIVSVMPPTVGLSFHQQSLSQSDCSVCMSNDYRSTPFAIHHSTVVSIYRLIQFDNRLQLCASFLCWNSQIMSFSFTASILRMPPFPHLHIFTSFKCSNAV